MSEDARDAEILWLRQEIDRLRQHLAAAEDSLIRSVEARRKMAAELAAALAQLTPPSLPPA